MSENVVELKDGNGKIDEIRDVWIFDAKRVTRSLQLILEQWEFVANFVFMMKLEMIDSRWPIPDSPVLTD